MNMARNTENLLDLRLSDLEAYFVSIGAKPFNARQAYKWIWQKDVLDVDEMTDLPKTLRQTLKENNTLQEPSLGEIQRSKDGTTKLQVVLQDGQAVECVLIPESQRNTLCISSQVGCAVGCRFCYTAGMGFSRNLTVSEIVGQYRLASRYAAEPWGRIDNVVMMGMGEPLYNLEAVVDACDILMDTNALGLGARKVTVSTSGVAPKIPELIERSRVGLAVSLNATTDEQRTKIMPINRKWNIAQLVEQLQKIPKPRRKRVFLEYVMLGGINDTMADAKRLLSIARRTGAKVNLIRFNPHPKADFLSPEEENVLQFQKFLVDNGVGAWLRKSRGQDIHAACGMLGKADKVR